MHWHHICFLRFGAASLPLACGNIKQLARMSLLCRSVYFYCWKSPVAKANFYFDRYGRRQAIFKAFATQFYQYPNFDLVLNAMIQNGARYSCLDRPQACPLLWLSQCKTKDPNALIKMFYECKPHISDEHLRQCLSTAVKKGSLPIICALFQLDSATVISTEITTKLAQSGVQWSFPQGWS
ncbi:hypothetical protein BDR26DRAFT_682295 [Obelidium mucronatum]|nr:hypothetical protein BDR26DRAFT_682295 [Obelidium mucronatum]